MASIDVNEDGKTWIPSQIVFDNDYAFSGDWFMRAMQFNVDNNNDLDEYLITPKLLPTTSNNLIEFYYRSTSQYWEEDFEVRLSTTGTDVEDFDVLLAANSAGGDEDWHLYSQDLSTYNDQEIYIAIVCCPNMILDLHLMLMPSHYP